jgi:hypothetical protein
VAPPDRAFDSPQQDASWKAPSTEIGRGLRPERTTLDPLHHDAGHDHGLAAGQSHLVFERSEFCAAVDAESRISLYARRFRCGHPSAYVWLLHAHQCHRLRLVEILKEMRGCFAQEKQPPSFSLWLLRLP